MMGRGANVVQAAERVLVQTAGVNMNTWIVGHVPVGHHIINPRFHPESKELEKQGNRTFFMKGRIMAGQANLAGNMFGLTDFKWLTKQEVQKHVANKYWSYVKNMLADR
jgi:large subunit ribosomal protein L46